MKLAARADLVWLRFCLRAARFFTGLALASGGRQLNRVMGLR